MNRFKYVYGKRIERDSIFKTGQILVYKDEFSKIYHRASWPTKEENLRIILKGYDKRKGIWGYESHPCGYREFLAQESGSPSTGVLDEYFIRNNFKLETFDDEQE